MEIKVRQTNGDHQWYIEWIEKFGWRPNNAKNERKTTENLHGFAYGNVTDELQKRLGLDFLHENDFFSLISSDPKIQGGLNVFLVHSSPY